MKEKSRGQKSLIDADTTSVLRYSPQFIHYNNNDNN